jgi:hypothetical protein
MKDVVRCMLARMSGGAPAGPLVATGAPLLKNRLMHIPIIPPSTSHMAPSTRSSGVRACSRLRTWRIAGTPGVLAIQPGTDHASTQRRPVGQV